MKSATIFRRLVAAVRRVAAGWRYRQALRRGEPAADPGYRFDGWPAPDPPLVELRLRAGGEGGTSETDAERWCRRQTLAELRAIGFDENGRERWRIEPENERLTGIDAAWFAAPGMLPNVVAAHLESALLVAAAEQVDAVVLCERVGSDLGAAVDGIDDVHRAALRPWALFRSDAYRWEPSTDSLLPMGGNGVAKFIDTGGVACTPASAATHHRTRRGPYLADDDLGASPVIGLRDASLLDRRAREAGRPAVLVTAPFLARGGAEQTLLATMQALRDRFAFSMATLAPHRPALGDRRPDFLEVTERIFCLGDLVHPDAMVGMLVGLLDATGAEILYNANGTTLFYDFAPQLKARRPGLRIIDHLYDHRIGYIDAYTPGLEDSVDVCVAENRPIADVLVGDRGWDEDRVPVIWPCGRPDDSLPAEDRRQEIRSRLRAEFDYSPDDVVFLTAARMHEQKRPLDLVALADRVRDLDTVHFLVVGGGDLENEIDAAIADTGGARIRRLAFREDIPELILAADAGCLVSDHEGLPVFMLECLQLGRPFLGTRVGDLGTVLDETGAGLVADRPGDLDALEDAVRNIADPDIRAELAARATEAAPRFSVAACADAYAHALTGGG